ncbi:hypothetical protein [Bradyrhizobium retamae]|uniref:Uncharacterized protein n=1 Tax=Bradyrhizobium retamae TaxID=1300035 RepID=A0A0R3MNM3_9BRAD|nr:hypothetical protein [Bradyrhizobium retamae]KRR21896.1 hypothetical protein CQ13_07625 [Bradyrhizobium retamae]
MPDPLHGVALVRISTSPAAVDGEFYAVFVRGRMLPEQFTAWRNAYRRFRFYEVLEAAVPAVSLRGA